MYENIYNSLNHFLPETDISETDFQRIVEKLKTFNAEKQEIFYFLIYYDNCVKLSSKKTVLPYKIKQTSVNTLDINMDNLPYNLKHILLKFADMNDS
jgi:hypothetical protein